MKVFLRPWWSLCWIWCPSILRQWLTLLSPPDQTILLKVISYGFPFFSISAYKVRKQNITTQSLSNLKRNYNDNQLLFSSQDEVEILLLVDGSWISILWLFQFKQRTFSICEKNSTTNYSLFKVFIFQSVCPYQINELRST